MNYFVAILAILSGWLIADLAWIEAKEIKGGFIQNLVKYLWPKQERWLIFYAVSAFVCGLIALYLFSLSGGELLIKLILLLASFVLLHSALVDVVCLQIPLYPSAVSLVILILFNAGLLILRGTDARMEISSTGLIYWASDNLIAAIAGAILFFLIIKLTKGKGMGEGDLLIFAMLGLLLGISKLIVAFYVMILVASVYGLIIAALKRRFKGLKLPFVPFMVLGYLVTLIYGQQIINTYVNLFL